MDIRNFITEELVIYWEKEYNVKWVSDTDKFRLEVYHFSEREKSKILIATRKKKVKYVGVEMPNYDGIFKYYTFSVDTLQDLFERGIISFTY